MSTFARQFLLASLFLLPPWPAMSADTNTSSQSMPVGRHVDQDISKWDTNKNGRLEPQELEAFRRDRMRERQEQLEARAKAAATTRRATAEYRETDRVVITAEALKKYDTNYNGRLEKEELNHYRQDLLKARAEKQRISDTTNTVPSSPKPAPAFK